MTCKKCKKIIEGSFVFIKTHGNYFCNNKCYDKYYFGEKIWYFIDFNKIASHLLPPSTGKIETNRFELMEL